MKVRLLLLLYNVLALVPLAAAAVAALFVPSWRKGLGERLGGPPGSPRPGEEETFWIHGASVGEILAARGIVTGLLKRRPRARLILSTFTPAGRRTAQEVYGGRGGNITCTLAPLDWVGIPGKVLDRHPPRLFVILETELWPNLLHALARRGVPLVLANGRLSTRSFPRYRALKWFFSPFLLGVSRACVRTAEDGDRYRLLGVPPERITVAGNVKHDRTTNVPSPGKASWEGRLGGEGEVMVAGSLRGHESEVILRAFDTLKKDFPRLRLVVAPRYPGSFDHRSLDARYPGWTRWSERGEVGPGEGEVLLLDTLGELADLYGAADVAFVGGTLEGTQGHNLLEPAAHGVPVLFGPGYSSFEEEGKALLSAGGGFLTPRGEDVAAAAARLLGDPSFRREAGRKARETAEGFTGAVERTLDVIEAVLEEGGP